MPTYAPALQLDIRGLRGFQSAQSLQFALPNGDIGSGLTLIVGANSSGKSTVVEALRALSDGGANRSFPIGLRNIAAASRVELTLHFGEQQSYGIKTVASGGSETEQTQEGGFTPCELLVVSPRRAFNARFGKTISDRGAYRQRLAGSGARPLQQDNFAGRLFHIQNHRAEFDAVLSRLLTPPPKWYIEQESQGQYFLRIEAPAGFHDSDGMGDGIASLFVIADALYDSKPESLIAIDEPELSLHPSLQRRLGSLLAEYSKDRQVVVATHSPYFLDPVSFGSGLQIARCFQTSEGSKIKQLSRNTLQRLASLTRDINNPHTLGLNARESLFQEDSVVLLEGQEDVQLLGNLCEQLGCPLEGFTFGWGVGGADKMELFVQMFHELGFQRVAGILDANKSEVARALAARFPEYLFGCIPADDIRTKRARDLQAVRGLLDEKYEVRDEYRQSAADLMRRVNAYLVNSRESAFVTPELKGRVVFQYSSNDGAYRIGTGDLAFDTKWTSASNESVHTYSDLGCSVAIAPHCNRIEDVKGTERLDFSSRSQTPKLGEVIVLKNRSGYFAALKICAVKARSHDDEVDELVFEFEIQREQGRRNFSVA